MTSKALVRVAEDVDESTLSYSEIKALATGNPLIKEKMTLDNEIARLKLLESNHKSNLFALEDKILKIYPKEIKSLESQIKNMKEDIRLIKPQDEFNEIKVGNEIIKDRKIAGDKLIQNIKNINIGNKEIVGEYRGFKIEVLYNHTDNTYRFNLKGKENYYGEFGVDPIGNLIRMDNCISKIKDSLNALEDKLILTKEQLKISEEEIEKPFGRKDELINKIIRLNEINKILDMGEERDEETELFINLKKALIEYLNQNFGENINYEDFNLVFPDYEHIKIYQTSIENQEVVFEVNLKDYTLSRYIDNKLINIINSRGENKEDKIRNLIFEFEINKPKDFVDYFESDVVSNNNFNSEGKVSNKGDKLSMLKMIKKFKEEIKLKDTISKTNEYEL